MKVFGILGLVLALALAVAGCGGGGDNESKTTATTPGQPSAGTATKSVKLAEYSFSPSSVIAKRGQTLKVENNGTIAHNLTVEKGPDPKKKTARLAGTPTFNAGETETLKVDLKPGVYAMVCTVAGHRELGMVGSFTVK